MSSQEDAKFLSVEFMAQFVASEHERSFYDPKEIRILRHFFQSLELDRGSWMVMANR